MNITDWKNDMNSLLTKLKGIDFGYPLDNNEILPRSQARVAKNELDLIDCSNHDELRYFYENCGGVNLPDIHVGYFIKSLEKLVTINPSSEPTRLIGEFADNVLSFGSTGGGGLLVLRKLPCDILHLAPGPLHNGTYDSNRGRATKIANSFLAFLEILLSDVRAFVENQRNHHYFC
ncbi:hypothetical protein BH10PLA2_BH10PLA2_18740 [soil metagenome]